MGQKLKTIQPEQERSGGRRIRSLCWRPVLWITRPDTILTTKIRSPLEKFTEVANGKSDGAHRANIENQRDQQPIWDSVRIRAIHAYKWVTGASGPCL
ncbi:MAG: hypothetical protein CMJ72_13695 [Planctomycetaceae bacterium]|nr:hypothetical protein [Planctomycetaceae bacterium]